jgi:hypothetical protein
MALIEQDHELGRRERRQRCVSRRPPQKLAGGESAQAEPEPIAVLDQEFQCGRGTIAEDRQGAGERVLLPLVATKRREGVDLFAKVDGIKG